jgi:hypothetical protein
MFDNCTATIDEIIRVLNRFKSDSIKKLVDFKELPLIFHYDTSFNIGENKK